MSKSIIGLEVHVELKTKSKMFCNCSADYFGQKPNTHTCPVCLGLPGALPVPNKQTLEWCVAIGLALNCEIPLFSKFDRKNYFYPDLPKGYQISQYDEPFCLKGDIEVNGKKFGITRVHMEEDTGKLMHEGDTSLIDFNRSGVPLVEIVTEPDFDNAADVKAYLQKLQQIVRYLEVSDADMEKGQMRLEPNISISLDVNSKKLPNYKVEVKNINSFGFVEKAINFELKRQLELLEKGETPAQETRGWDEKKQQTVTQRLKEEANDYRYFPEPDIPPIRWKRSEIDKLREFVKERSKYSPENRISSSVAMGMSAGTARSLANSQYRTDVFDAAIEKNIVPVDERVKFATYLDNIPEPSGSTGPNYNPSNEAARLYEQYVKTNKKSVIDEEELNKIINNVIKENEKAVLDYKNGNKNVIMFLVGQVMRQFKEKVDAEQIKAVLTAKLK